jgi:uncharacterized protein YoxC
MNGANDLDAATRQLDNGVASVRGISNTVYDLGQKAKDVKNAVNLLPGQLCQNVLGYSICIDVPYIGDVQRTVGGAAATVESVGNAANGIVQTASGLGIQGKNLARDTKEVGQNLASMASDIDNMNSKIESSARDVENQIHQTGQSLYSIKAVFYYGLLAIFGVGIVGALSGAALLAVARTLSAQSRIIMEKID